VRTSLRSDEEVALLRARSWIDKCTTSPSHAICRVQVTERTLPARFIHIPKDLHDICLHKAESIQTFHGLRYATLTHCWGVSAAPLLATKGNLDQMYQRIPFNALGKTFQDAISICQRLGLHYLWIDSLCIVQDDDSDWQNQAAAMGNIFAGCTINIVASASENGKITR
jgi:cbb3-type cytochrome oxidase subunit 1